MDAATAAFIASCKEKEGATKKMPTIFKYNGDAKEVYLCGKSQNYLNNFNQMPSYAFYIYI